MVSGFPGASAVVGRDGIEPPTLQFQPGEARPDPFRIIRLSGIRAA
jgi:hypothetical protein